MGNSVKKFSELKVEKNKLKVLGQEQVKEMKNSFDKVKKEGQNALVNKIIIPAGAALIVGYGLKKLVDYLSSDYDHAHIDTSDQQDRDLYVKQQTEPLHAKKSNGFLSNVDWAALVVKAAPFIIGVGKKMYEEGNLPFFQPPGETDGVGDV